jgi:hypothetical protein
MQNMFALIVTTLLLSALWTPLALAEPVELTEQTERSVRPPLLRTRLNCTTDGDRSFGERGEGRGAAEISAIGEVRFTLFGLAPHTELTCVLVCIVTGGEAKAVVQETCTADAQGRINTSFPRRAHPSAIGGGCLLPTLIAANDTVACVSGYGRVNAEPLKR